MLKTNPGLRPLLDEILDEAYQSARLVTSRKTDLDEATFPEVCPYAFEDVLADKFWPD